MSFDLPPLKAPLDQRTLDYQMERLNRPDRPLTEAQKTWGGLLQRHMFRGLWKRRQKGKQPCSLSGS